MGLMLAEPGFHTRAFVEWEDWPRGAIIAAQRAGYFAPAPIWDDLRTFDASQFRGAFDAVLAGYPCQPFSAAGKRGGADDPRHLWPEVARVIDECRPEWVFLENVAGHISLGLETVLRDLWSLGYTPAAGAFSAAETGAPHERLRVFIVGHSEGVGRREGRAEHELRNRRETPPGAGRELADTSCRRSCRSEGREVQQSRRAQVVSTGDTLADPGRAGCQGREQRCSLGEQDRPPSHGPAPERSCPRVYPPGPADTDAWAEVIRDAPHLAPAISLGDVKRAADHFAQMVAEGIMEEAQAESVVRLCADGMADRARALRLLGNGVVPIQAAHAWRSLSAAHGLGPVDLGARGCGGSAGADAVVR